MEASTGHTEQHFGLLVTSEVRWFMSGEIPKHVRDWFTAGGVLGSREERLDRYDLPSAHRGIGLKYRGDVSLDAKHLLHAIDGVDLGYGFRGRVEDWVKVVKPIPPDHPQIAEQLIVVEKELITRSYSAAGDQVDSVRSTFGCEIELAALRVAGQTAWSFCLETFGDPVHRELALINGLKAMVADTPLDTEVAVTSVDSRGYPTWVSQLAHAA